MATRPDSSMSPIRTSGGLSRLSQSLADWVADLGQVVIEWVCWAGKHRAVHFSHFPLAVHSHSSEGNATAQLLPDWGAQPSRRGTDRDVHRHGVGGAELCAVPDARPGDATGGGDQYVAGAGVGAGAGGDDARRPRGQRHGGGIGHDAGDRADRRPGEHGRQPDPLPGRAPIPRLPGADPDADDHGRLHGSGRRGRTTASTSSRSTGTITSTIRGNTWGCSICSRAYSRASGSVRPSP